MTRQALSIGLALIVGVVDSTLFGVLAKSFVNPGRCLLVSIAGSSTFTVSYVTLGLVAVFLAADLAKLSDASFDSAGGIEALVFFTVD